MSMDADTSVYKIIEGVNRRERDDLYKAWLHSPIRFEKSFEDYLEELKPYRKSTQEEKDEILRKYGGA